MKTLSYYKNRYKKAVGVRTKTRIINLAMSNLSHEYQQNFISWQVKLMYQKHNLTNTYETTDL